MFVWCSDSEICLDIFSFYHRSLTEFIPPSLLISAGQSKCSHSLMELQQVSSTSWVWGLQLLFQERFLQSLWWFVRTNEWRESSQNPLINNQWQDTWCSKTWASRSSATSRQRFVTIRSLWGWSSTRGRSNTSTTFAPSQGNMWVPAKG